MLQNTQICKKIYEFELQCHNKDETLALTCMYKNHGGNVVDLAANPTIFTRANLLVTVLSKTIFKTSIVLPSVKMMAFLFDFVKDLSLGFYLYRLLYDEESKDRTSSSDFYLFHTYVSSLFFGQILLSFYCYRYRYTTISACHHQESTLFGIVVSAIMVILLLKYKTSGYRLFLISNTSYFLLPF